MSAFLEWLGTALLFGIAVGTIWLMIDVMQDRDGE